MPEMLNSEPEPGEAIERCIDAAESAWRLFSDRRDVAGPKTVAEARADLERLRGDESAGDVVAAYSDGAIVLDDGVTTHSYRRACEFLATENARLRAARPSEATLPVVFRLASAAIAGDVGRARNYASLLVDKLHEAGSADAAARLQKMLEGDETEIRSLQRAVSEPEEGEKTT